MDIKFIITTSTLMAMDRSLSRRNKGRLLRISGRPYPDSKKIKFGLEYADSCSSKEDMLFVYGDICITISKRYMPYLNGAVLHWTENKEPKLKFNNINY